MADNSETGISKPTLQMAQLEHEAGKESSSQVDKAEIVTTSIEGIEIQNTVPLSTEKRYSHFKASATEGHSSSRQLRPSHSSKRQTDSAAIGRGGLYFPENQKEILKVAWDKDIDPSTSSYEILETLAASSYALGRQTKWPLRVKEREVILVFEELHLTNIQRLQLRLLDISRGCADPAVANDDEIHRLLHQYREDLDDYEAIKNGHQHSASALSRLGGLASHLKDHGISIWCMGQRPPIGTHRSFQSYLYIFLHFFTQLFFAITGGLQLIVPLLIMVYVPGKTASVTTCVAVCAFAGQLAIWSSLAHFVELSDFWFFRLARSPGVKIGAAFEAKDIIDAAFAYAAVLVVFVGTSI